MCGAFASFQLTLARDFGALFIFFKFTRNESARIIPSGGGGGCCCGCFRRERARRRPRLALRDLAAAYWRDQIHYGGNAARGRILARGASSWRGAHCRSRKSGAARCARARVRRHAIGRASGTRAFCGAQRAARARARQPTPAVHLLNYMTEWRLSIKAVAFARRALSCPANDKLRKQLAQNSTI